MAKVIEAHEEKMMKDIILQLKEFGYTETEGKSLRELVFQLALEQEVGSPHSGWF